MIPRHLPIQMLWLLWIELALAGVVLGLVVYLIVDLRREFKLRQQEEFEDELEELLDGG